MSGSEAGQEAVDRRLPWLVFSLVVVLVVAAGCILLAFLLPAPGAWAIDSGAPQLGGEGLDPPCLACVGRVGGGSLLLGPVALLLLLAGAPLLLLGLLVSSMVWFSRSGMWGSGAASHHCLRCHHAVKADWIVCPYCARELGTEQ